LLAGTDFGLVHLCQEATGMSDLSWLTDKQMTRIARVDDRQVLSGIIFVIRNGLPGRDAPSDYGPHKAIYNRFIRRGRPGVDVAPAT
jgi:putative transposase